MFLGEYEYSLDAKGRVFIPARYREELGDKFVVTMGTDKCLTVYPLSEWEKYSAKIAEMPRTQSLKIRRFLFGNACDYELDPQGRLLLRPEQRKYAGLEKNITFLGMGSTFEIWPTEVREADKEEIDPEEIADLLMQLGL